MSLRGFLELLRKEGGVKVADQEVDPHLEIAKILSKEEKAVLFTKVKNSPYQIVGNVLNSRKKISLALETKEEELFGKLSQAIKNPSHPEIIKEGQCQEVIETEVDLSKLPILTHTSLDLGPYLTSGIFIANDVKYGLNASFHRASPIAKNKLVARICQRDLYKYLARAGGGLPVAICIGLSPAVLISAAISAEIGKNELEIANFLSPLKLVKCKNSDIYVPSDAEIVLEGVIIQEKHSEGPFLDVTQTMDITREEPVIKINLITHRKNPLYHALLPSAQEHTLLMGLPREPFIFNEVNQVCQCLDVLLTLGGCNWLHGVVKINKKNPDDGKKAIEAAFNAHKSLKHLVIVDKDINIHNSQEVEWSIATRFQGDKNLVMRKEKGSSLDPSAAEDRMTCKLGIDATIPSDEKKEKFEKRKLGE